MNSYKENYLGILDGVRGLMAFWVFFSHLMLATIGKNTPWGGGGYAVDIFMLLSGFLMAYHWRLRENKIGNFKHQTKDFYIRRFFRIAPLYYLLVTIAFLGQGYFFHVMNQVHSIVPSPWARIENQFNGPTDSSLSFLNIVSHYSFVFGFFPQYAANNIIPDWSIGLEMQFYIIFPLIMLIIPRIGIFTIVAGSLIVAFMTNDLIGLYFTRKILGIYPEPSMILFKINIFVAGISLAIACLQSNKWLSLPWLIGGFISLATCSIHVTIAAFFIVIMLFFDPGRNELANKFISGRIAKFLGDTSYSVYLAHNMILFPILSLLFQCTWFLSLPSYPRLFISFVLIGFPVYLIAAMLFKVVELPGIRLGRKIILQREIIPLLQK